MESVAVRDAIKLFRRRGGILRTTQALALGIHPRTLYQMRDASIVEPVSRGVYRLTSLPPLGEPDLATVALRVPRAVVCLVSALSYHRITTQVPREVQIALPRGTKSPLLHYPPIRVFRFSGAALTAGIETHRLDGVAVRIYRPEKTVVDCFRFRNKIGIDVAIEALQLVLKNKRMTAARILPYARICRVEKIMLPYLEALQ
jgi:predicted transcriptional regulator of viral defense system